MNFIKKAFIKFVNAFIYIFLLSLVKLLTQNRMIWNTLLLILLLVLLLVYNLNKIG